MNAQMRVTAISSGDIVVPRERWRAKCRGFIEAQNLAVRLRNATEELTKHRAVFVALKEELMCAHGEGLVDTLKKTLDGLHARALAAEARVKELEDGKQ